MTRFLPQMQMYVEHGTDATAAKTATAINARTYEIADANSELEP